MIKWLVKLVESLVFLGPVELILIFSIDQRSQAINHSFLNIGEDEVTDYFTPDVASPLYSSTLRIGFEPSCYCFPGSVLVSCV